MTASTAPAALRGVDRLSAWHVAFHCERFGTNHSGWLPLERALWGMSFQVLFLGATLAFFAVEVVPGLRPYILALSSASLLYIAMSDLIPDLHRGEIDANALRQVLLIAAGIATIVVFERLVG